MTDLYRAIYGDLLKHENKKRAETHRRYHKYGGHRSFGVPSAVREELFKRYKPAIGELSCHDALALAGRLAKMKIEDTVMAGNFILREKQDCFNKSDLSFLDRYADNFCSWSTTDDFCIDVLQPILSKYPKETIRLLEKWNRSKSIWKRRASVVAFVRNIGKSGRFTKDALKLCDNLISDKEDLVQKGIGWCLKDIMRGDKKKVLEYIKRLRKQGAPATITLYAIRNLSKPERTCILKS